MGAMCGSVYVALMRESNRCVNVNVAPMGEVSADFGPYAYVFDPTVGTVGAGL